MLPRTTRGSLRLDNLHRRRPATCDQDPDDRDGDLLDRRLSLPSWTTRCAKSCASSSPSPAFALMRSMIPRPSRRAASSTSESRRPIRAARTRTWRISPSSIESVVFTFPISPYCHTEVKVGWLDRLHCEIRFRRFGHRRSDLPAMASRSEPSSSNDRGRVAIATHPVLRSRGAAGGGFVAPGTKSRVEFVYRFVDTPETAGGALK